MDDFSEPRGCITLQTEGVEKSQQLDGYQEGNLPTVGPRQLVRLLPAKYLDTDEGALPECYTRYR